MVQSHDNIVYRLATLDEWQSAQLSGVVPTRDIDRIDGYMHLSTREQLLETARLHFSGVPDLVALGFNVEALAGHLKFEIAPKRGEAFPHYYGMLDSATVTSVCRIVEVDESFCFGEAL